jgi:hypothetical protein
MHFELRKHSKAKTPVEKDLQADEVVGWRTASASPEAGHRPWASAVNRKAFSLTFSFTARCHLTVVREHDAVDWRRTARKQFLVPSELQRVIEGVALTEFHVLAEIA